jgi:hypothetical protein
VEVVGGSTVSAAAAGGVLIDGTGSAASGGSYGVHLNAANVSTVNGPLTITARGGAPLA